MLADDDSSHFLCHEIYTWARCFLSHEICTAFSVIGSVHKQRCFLCHEIYTWAKMLSLSWDLYMNKDAFYVMRSIDKQRCFLSHEICTAFTVIESAHEQRCFLCSEICTWAMMLSMSWDRYMSKSAFSVRRSIHEQTKDAFYVMRSVQRQRCFLCNEIMKIANNPWNT